MAVTTTTISPDFTGTVDQRFFIEPFGGAAHPLNYLDRFSDSLYNKGIDSNFVILMYTLLGPAGVGSVQQDYLKVRLAVEAAQLDSGRLDDLYANPLSFARTLEEQNNIDASGLLTPEEQAELDTQDASFRNRVIDFLHAVRAGGTVQGLALAAKSGLGYPVEIVENYKALYDGFSDLPLGLTKYGTTQSTEEVIILPRPEVSQSSIQILTLSNAQSGNFALLYPVGNNPLTIAIPFNAAIETIQADLIALPSIGTGDVLVTGGPLPDTPIQIMFMGLLANQAVPELQVLYTPSVQTTGIIGFTGLSSLQSGVVATASVTQVQAGISADTQQVPINPQDIHNMMRAMANIKPVTTIVTTGIGQGTTLRQPANAISSSHELTSVVRYVIGNSSVPWPDIDASHWIEASVEHESPTIENDHLGNYQGFHNITNIISYTEGALVDSLYGTTVSSVSGTGAAQWPAVYNDAHLGGYTAVQTALYPFLSSYTDPATIFYASQAEAFQAEPLSITGRTLNGTAIVNRSYPVDYQGLPGVPQQPNQPFFWSSLERATGTDYLEIDLGTDQAVNFVYFQASSKPYTITVSYDTLDQYPSRNFIPVTWAPQSVAPSNTGLVYAASNSNPWTPVHLHFTNSLGLMIYTRFIRIEFTKLPGGTNPFQDAVSNPLPYSIEVQNLRIGRNIA